MSPAVETARAELAALAASAGYELRHTEWSSANLDWVGITALPLRLGLAVRSATTSTSPEVPLDAARLSACDVMRRSLAEAAAEQAGTGYRSPSTIEVPS